MPRAKRKVGQVMRHFLALCGTMSPFYAQAKHIISLLGLRGIELGCEMYLTRNLDGSKILVVSICILGSLASL